MPILRIERTLLLTMVSTYLPAERTVRHPVVARQPGSTVVSHLLCESSSSSGAGPSTSGLSSSGAQLILKSSTSGPSDSGAQL